jgi:hypothetical protein
MSSASTVDEMPRDMREWRRTVNSVAELIDETVARGLFSAETERGYDVLETSTTARSSWRR